MQLNKLVKQKRDKTVLVGQFMRGPQIPKGHERLRQNRTWQFIDSHDLDI